MVGAWHANEVTEGMPLQSQFLYAMLQNTALRFGHAPLVIYVSAHLVNGTFLGHDVSCPYASMVLNWDYLENKAPNPILKSIPPPLRPLHWQSLCRSR